MNQSWTGHFRLTRYLRKPISRPRPSLPDRNVHDSTGQQGISYCSAGRIYKILLASDLQGRQIPHSRAHSIPTRDHSALSYTRQRVYNTHRPAACASENRAYHGSRCWSGLHLRILCTYDPAFSLSSVSLSDIHHLCRHFRHCFLQSCFHFGINQTKTPHCTKYAEVFWYNQSKPAIFTQYILYRFLYMLVIIDDFWCFHLLITVNIPTIKP